MESSRRPSLSANASFLSRKRRRAGAANTRFSKAIWLRILLAICLPLGLVVASTAPAAALPQTTVVLDFDGNTISQYTLGYLQALQPHGVNGTFFVNSGTVGGSVNFMSWSQVTTLAGAGNDIGGKTVNASNLTTDANPTAQVCNDRAALLQHNLTPIGFAYPGGATNATVKAIVKNCGYGNGRTAGSLSPTGPTYAETVPPADWFGVRAYAPSAVTLANMQALVSGATSHNGGWSQIVIGKICSQALDPNNYSTCSTASGHLELADLNAFLDWMANAGLPGGAPTGAALGTVRGVATAADTSAPTSVIACNSAPCSPNPYTGVVSVSLTATDTGSGVQSIHFTTDGSDPSLTSTTYTGPFNVNGAGGTTTVKFRAYDYAGKAEATNSQTIQAPADTTAPTTSVTCNSAACTAAPYVGSVSVALSAADAGGSGVAATYYTTDGSTPTTSSTVYSAAFQLNVPATYNVQYFSTDRAGNAETVQSQQVKVVPIKTLVSLAFDNGTVSQYTLGYQQALAPHAAHATFFVNSGTVGVSANVMTWSQLGSLVTAGDDVGGKTVSATNLTTDPNPTAQVCNDRAALVQHGLSPAAFAYPGGAFNASVEGIVKSCGYGNGRTAGSLAPAGPTYAETLPPKDWFATRAYAPTSQVTLANIQALVNGAAAHNGGWSQIVVGRVCSQAQDAGNYAACTVSAGWIELADLNSFLDWIQNAGQAGGAPAGAALNTVREALVSADATAPNTTISCNGAACSSGVYTSTVQVSLASTDVGSSTAGTRYTTDGSDPSLSSPLYTTAFPVTSTTTVKFRSWDNAGNAEPTNTQLINTSLPPDTTPPATTIACDGAPCGGPGYNGTTTVSLTASDAGGWGVDKSYYTLDGSAPSTSSTVYTAPITLSTQGTYTVQFFSTDLAGNAEQPHSQQIIVLAPKVIVSLTFDDGLASHFLLADKRALLPHHLTGTFYNVSGLNNVDEQHMTWAQLTSLNNDGNEVGGHTVDHVALKGMTDLSRETYEVCQDRQNLIDHGFYPTSFAYPTGAYDATAESVVQSCGYSTARAAGGIDVAGEGAGPVYAETTSPPKDNYATRTVYDPASGSPPNVPPLTLNHLKASVAAAAQHGGGWVTFTFHEICSQTYDPTNYSFCISDWGPIELDTLNAFLDWLQTSGQAGGAPARTSVQTVAQVINGPDTLAPITTLNCDGSPCQTSTYHGSTTVSLAAKDPGGSGVKTTYFTTDGSTPTTSSQIYTAPFTINQPTTVTFFSIDNSGNVESVKSTHVDVQPNPDPIIAAAGDIACDPTAPAFNNGLGTATDCRASHTAQLLDGVDAVLPLGDNQYECGGPAAYQQSYDPTWGVKKPITHPVPGDKDYGTTGGTDCPSTPGAGYYSYFGSAAGDPAKGYYSYNLGSWHVIALNTAPCPTDASTCNAGSAQELWLKQDLAANPTSCTLAYYQNPRWASTASGSGGDATFQAIWQDLYAGGVDVVLNGDSHWYERFAQVNASGQPDPTYGTREFIVGTGGAGLDTPGAPISTSQALNAATHGVARMTLHNGSYSWAFMPDEGTFTDSGTANCHPAPPPPDQIAPATMVSCNGAACQSGAYPAAVSVSLTAGDNVGGSGVASTHYTTDGTDPALTSPTYTAPFSVPITTTVKFRSWDAAGNVEATNTQVIQVDGSAPVTTILCNGAACSAGWYTAAVSVSLAATDSGGVSSTHYTTDGTDPTLASPSYTAPFSVGSTSTVKYRSWDNTGNVEATNSQAITIDGTAPTSTTSCNGSACQSTAYFGSASIALTAADDVGGSGVASIHYTTDGTDPSLSSPSYTASFTVTATTTVKFRAWDTAGNVEATKSQLVQITPDAAPVARLTVSPASGIAPVVVTANASTSTDTDPTPIASYAFNFGDGSAVVTQAAASLSHTYTTAGTFTVAVTAKDSAGLASTASQPVVIKANLVSNSGFETNVSRWSTNASSVTLARVSGGHAGSWSARLTNTGGTAGVTTLDDNPNSVTRTSAGTYSASLWVKGATAGRILTLRLREMSGAVVVGSASATVTLSTSWQLVTVSYRTAVPGSTLDFNAFVSAVPAGAVGFYADDAAITLS
ncbi:MAG: Alkaline phosphatase [Pseudonocardiales bacterium]|nr:Alkaline phosphatase [Pseudonocardiales bacterium]